MVIEISNGVTRHPAYRMNKPVDFYLCESEQLAIIGENGAGKSMLVDILTGKHPLLGEGVKYDFGEFGSRMLSDNLKYISFKDTYGTGDDNQYYQLRWNTHEEDGSPIVGDALEETYNIVQHSDKIISSLSEEEKQRRNAERERMRGLLYEAFGINKIIEQKLTHLSSGELRKFHLTRSLLSNPRLIIIDNPFIGLDVVARNQFVKLFEILIKEIGIQVMLVLSRPSEIPSFVTHVVEISEKTVGKKMTFSEYMKVSPNIPEHVISDSMVQSIMDLPPNYLSDCNVAIDFKDVSIRYGKRTILDKLNFTIKGGEKWALTGRNGSGKSTLLSIVCADNLQSYANQIILFDKVRGTGESIWDIKRHIGYVSPELHRSYYRDIPAVDIVASGLSDSIGLYMRPKPEHMDVCHFWMNVFGIKHLANTSFLQLSSGEQRLVLLARAFVKDPALLILDEPLHGLDPMNSRRVLDVIETFAKRKGKTLIVVTHYMEEIPACVDKVLKLGVSQD